ncbi:GH36-type glycosyl hydrolase domain-containing protein [Neobacillus sp. YIM B06451]|uniref:GH36-type glycosyl hydrolase domain-containing protein n=1 Tax=Neobacillus sp. YIM B06451 TaxID=3070994 RepID=UPI0029316590|nr:cellobiose phosphorylase [Neobacillus sp. YIM B06451]
MPMLNETMFTVEKGKTRFTFLESGDLYFATHGEIMLNQVLGNPLDGSLNNLYLRFHEGSQIDAVPLLGIKSTCSVRHEGDAVVWQGKAKDIAYMVTLRLEEQGLWFWEVDLEGGNAEVDVIYTQDLGLGSQGFVRSNEAYLSHYIDHSIYENKYGYAVCSRQNQPQPGGFPYLQQGSLTGAVGYSTDGFQFYGLSYKETDRPEALEKPFLPNEIYQYEFAFTALQSRKIKLNGNEKVVFYGLFKENHPEAVTSLEYTNEIEDAWNRAKGRQKPSVPLNNKPTLSSVFGKPLKTDSMSQQDIDTLFPNRIEEEWDGDTLLSFFTDTYEHIVLKEKELLVERPHGHIVMTGNNAKMKENTLTSTSYMYGIFNSQVVVGNTSFNKMMTNARNHLNVLKTSGQRIYVELDGKYRLLTMPSLFEIGFNYTRWHYKFGGDTIIITNFTSVETPELVLSASSKSGRKYRYLVTNQISMNSNEYEVPFRMEQDGQSVLFKAGEHAESSNSYPGLSYKLHIRGAKAEITDEQIFAVGIPAGSAGIVALALSETPEWSIVIQGRLHGEDIPLFEGNADLEIEKYRAFLKNVMNGFRLGNEKTSLPIEKVNAVAWWYTHNMLVHYSVPHGLEQYGGAAWGTRDVCQGPVEYFLATQNDGSAREIIKTVYSHQYEDSGNWPQWFMFDNYSYIQAGESHGDIIVWPLKVLGDYITATGDYGILEEQVPYTINGSFKFTQHNASILDHAKKEIEYIKNNFLHDTYLSSYGDGDWDDTLQPANAQLKKYMVSSWTVALTYQTIKGFAKALGPIAEKEASELEELARGIESDYQTYMLSTGILPGFIYMEEPGKPELMVHPEDNKTGINYRLLPMTRSMISELLSPDSAKAHYELIKEHLYCPDGVRLMNRPANYEGGVSTNFKRAEQAANFGREIGLQYVHAHIRFVEAMAKLGKADEAWKGLETINPVGLKDAVPNADFRQSNAYFSSSDGSFKTRYEARERFDELKAGKVKVKGGWRIYSSGPGIYMNQLISNCLGIRRNARGLIIDPVLPQELDGLRFDFKFDGLPVAFIYHLEGNSGISVKINGETVDGEMIANRYRSGGLLIERNLLKQLLGSEKNEIEIFM